MGEFSFVRKLDFTNLYFNKGVTLFTRKTTHKLHIFSLIFLKVFWIGGFRKLNEINGLLTVITLANVKYRPEVKGLETWKW